LPWSLCIQCRQGWMRLRLNADKAMSLFHRHIPNNGIGYIVARHRQGKGNTNICVWWSRTCMTGHRRGESRTPLSTIYSVYYDVAMDGFDRVSASWIHPFHPQIFLRHIVHMDDEQVFYLTTTTKSQFNRRFFVDYRSRPAYRPRESVDYAISI